eukprot:gb/GECG01002989.1/.p1 GENE.gb/GECG01002989.1/~~gb/GECG01002989.1/.p1  ORF type:complete len:194 (+),score=5.05 gb/GECG01002989.1/:1-582(+)
MSPSTSVAPEDFSEDEWNGYIAAAILTGVFNLLALFATVDQMTNYMHSTRRNVTARRAPHKVVKMGSCCSCRLDFRKSIFVLLLISLILKLGWYIDPVGLHGLYPHPVRLVGLRVSQACLLQCIAMIGLMWRRLALAQSRFQKIKSVIMIGRYKAELFCLSLILLVMVGVSVTGALGVEQTIMENVASILVSS